jgi:hypothetical protein
MSIHYIKMEHGNARPLHFGDLVPQARKISG